MQTVPNLTDLLRSCQILPDLTARTKKAVLEELCSPALALAPGLCLSLLMNVLQERERLGSTGIGDGVAIPHGKLTALERLILVFGRSRDGIDFDSLDGRPAHLFFLVLAPGDSAGIHLKALARISRLLKSQSVRSELMRAMDAKQILNIIKTQETL
ncbi:MAG: PTS sugar transporter subunit IIA [Desulfarculales bacterium]|nr:PTS sugar transporter subunit IIA [Desulfarculales bacterium]